MTVFPRLAAIRVPFYCLVAVSIFAFSSRVWASGELELRVVDKDTGELVPVRMHLKDQRGRPRKPPKVPFWKDHFVFGGKIILKLPDGRYTFEVERGPEYRIQTGNFIIKRGATDNKELVMQRFVDMKKEGWWSGDLHIHRDPRDIELLMLAEDLHVGPVITWWNDKNLWDKGEFPEKQLVQFDSNRFYHLMAGEDERGGGALLYFNLNEPLPITGSQREFPSPVEYLKLARKHDGAHVDIEKPFWWDMPLWIASGMCHSIGLCNNHMWRDGILDNEAWGKPRDKKRYRSPHGNGLWTANIYYKLLNCGIRMPPSAGSASGVLNNPVGYNRVYVHCGDELNYDKWWEGLRAGRVVVTNGPMMRPRVNGQLPGHIFRAQDGQEVELDISLNLSLRDKVDYLEIVKNGLVTEQVMLDEWAKKNGKLPKIRFEKSGWMLVRAIADNRETFRFASTGPYYVEIGGKPRVSKSSAQFFLDWVNERIGNIKLTDAEQRESVMIYHAAARKFWEKIVGQANAE
jgi:hypothetical protein